ncbi:MAG: hypothetical protein LBR60_00745 [Fibrobacter sp.]|jgi:hypothetical protein|nr:hypothetical protein [Fibrobacter sp.]
MLRNISFVFALLCALPLWAAPVAVLGVALEAESDRPVPYVDVYYRSGKLVGQTDAQGRFEFESDSPSAVFLFVKAGYDSTWAELADYGDLLDVVVSLRSNVRDLGQTTTISDHRLIQWENTRQVSVEKLEDAAGMRFDLTEHLSQIEGVSGLQDFSSALYYDGSRAEEVGYHLGRLRVPNMRHLDVGFPGNLSVINPHLLQGIEIHDHYGTGPLGQGLATSVQYLPENPPGDVFEARLAAGTTLREVMVGGPWFFWDSFRVSVRFLDAEMLKNMGEKFYTEFRKRDASCTDCTVAKSDPFDLTSYDVYAQISGSDSVGNHWAINALYSVDDYVIRQDTTSALDQVNSVDMIEGYKNYLVTGLEYNSALGTSWHLGFVNTMTSDSLRDTTGFRRNSLPEASSFIDGYSESHMTWSLGLDKPFGGHIIGAKLSGAVLFEYHMLERKWVDFSEVQKANFRTGVLSGSSRMQWTTDRQQTLFAFGAVSDLDGHGSPVVSLDAERKLSPGETGFRLFGNAAYRADWVSVLDDGEFTGDLLNGLSGKLGSGYRSRFWNLSAHGFGRYYADPVLPQPIAYAQYHELSNSDYAWVMGASSSFEWRTIHHFAFATNLSSVYGEYALSDGKSLPWQANSRLDMVSHFRYYPRKDSLISVIVSHRAAWHRPLYYYEIKPSHRDENSNEVTGSRQVRFYDEFSNLYRTDVRVNLDFRNVKGIFKNVRFYVEADNVFANLNVEALKFLGTDNYRERSQVVRDPDGNSDNGYDLIPFMAKGMGLYLQFGVEAEFEI